MTRGSMKTLLGRWLQDVSGVEWDDTEKNELLNLAYSKVQKEIVKAGYAEAHVYWDKMNTTAGESWYPLPATFGIFGVALSDGSGYKWLGRPHALEDIEGSVDTATTRYCQVGQWIGLFPAPSAAVTDGIRILHCPVMQMADDAEYPKIKLPLHDAIVLWAKLIAKGDTDEGDNGETRARLQEIMGDLASWYDMRLGGETAIQVMK